MNKNSHLVTRVAFMMVLFNQNPTGTPGISDPFSPLTSVAWSPTRPLVFAAAGSSGFLYMFDLMTSEAGPVSTVEIPTTQLVAVSGGGGQSSKSTAAAAAAVAAAAASSSGGGGGGSGGVDKKGSAVSSTWTSGSRRAAVTGLAFNRKQRGMLAVCDSAGRVHLFKLGWRFSSRVPGEQEKGAVFTSSAVTEK